MSLSSITFRWISDYFLKRVLTNKIIFLHIPKCGGTSINNAIASFYRIPLDLQSRKSINLDAAASLEASRFCGIQLSSYREYLLAYFLALKYVNFISGHFFINKRMLTEYCNQWDFITILRNPVSRWFSHYFFNRYKNGEHFKINDDLETFVESDTGIMLGHYYISILTGHGYESRILKPNAAGDAISILKKFAIVGCLEHLDIFKSQFAKLYGRELQIRHLRKNPLKKSDQMQHVSKKIIRQVETICQPDLEVYEFALNQLSRFG